MPRARKIVTEKLDAEELRRSVKKKAVKLHSPYAVVKGEDLSQHEDNFYIIYTAPRGGQRRVVASRAKRINAVKLRDLLNDAWTEGFASSGRE